MFPGRTIFEMIFEILSSDGISASGIGIFVQEGCFTRSSPHFLAHPTEAYVFDTLRWRRSDGRLRLAPGWWIFQA